MIRNRTKLTVLALGCSLATALAETDTLQLPPIAGGPFRADWNSLTNYQTAPEWFRDAKFGIWAHWGPQCQPEHGDWYARLMYLEARSPWMQGETAYQHHLKHYGHPSRTGFIDVIGDWRAQDWQPEYLIRRYAKAGAR